MMNDAATQAACLLAVDPAGLGGLCLRGGHSPARDALLTGLRTVLPVGTPWRRVPLQVDDDRLLGGLDLGASLATGRPVQQPGLIAEAAGGLLLLPMAERADAGLAARLAAALDDREARVGLVALDEGLSPDETLPASLQERLGLIATVTLDAHGSTPEFPALATVDAARARLAAVACDEATVQALSATASALGIVSMRTVWQAWCAARASAALAGRSSVTQADAELAARLVLAPRARALPAPAEPPEAQAPPSPPPESQERPDAPSTDATTPSPSEVQALQEQTLAAAQAAIPPGLLESLAGMEPRQGAAGGRRGAPARPAQSGRPLASRRGSLGAGKRLDLLATLRAAVPWQHLRRRERDAQGLPSAPTRLLLRRDDFHIKRYRRPQETTTVFVVDASGSQALHRLAEAKGAVELLLADCYVRRDRVALIAFRGAGAELLLPPTRSLARARRSLASLPGGGGTPLAAGLEAASLLGGQVQARDGGRAVLVFLTDARANIARDGSPGRTQAAQDALAVARRVRAQGLHSLLIDTSPRPEPAALLLAQTLGARYVPLPHGQAAQVHAVVAQAI
ncbi:magnesium chelatase subunit D [Roseateles puraquae]|uniref:Magnesium chelatase ATPase subunit D n=1 Tax=Roseateles puraquae TaxID=431059 RepID=A0A254N8P1_9BURK|nr:magnesium chelatase subunit D [Roseateles puraquae]MDG0855101.1 magnesium chelatase subunit D [Roseateles puraquae]OWR02727.1 magnesium chelatase ATPase subunit D [Roseateles puraquae]